MVTVWDIRLFQSAFAITIGISRFTVTKSVWVAISVEVDLSWTEGLKQRCSVGADHSASGPAASLTDHSWWRVLEMDRPAKKVALTVVDFMVELVWVDHCGRWNNNSSAHIDNNQYTSARAGTVDKVLPKSVQVVVVIEC